MSDNDYLLRQIASLTNAVNEQRAALDKCYQTIGGLEWTVQELRKEMAATGTRSSILVDAIETEGVGDAAVAGA